MLDALFRVCDEGGRLIGVSCAQFVGEPDAHPFVTAVALRFESLAVAFRAMPDDSLATSIGVFDVESDEQVRDLSEEWPWRSCIGLGVVWGWRLTNQQGYTDGVRFEFSKPGESSRNIVELIAIASGIRVFEAVHR